MKKQKRTAQGNQGEDRIPGGAGTYSGQPFYISLALWCLHRNTWINRDDIAREFNLSERKALLQFSYLIRKKSVIDCEVRRVRHENSATDGYEIRGDHVSLPQAAVPEDPFPRRIAGKRRNCVGNASQEVSTLLRQLWPVKTEKGKLWVSL